MGQARVGCWVGLELSGLDVIITPTFILAFIVVVSTSFS